MRCSGACELARIVSDHPSAPDDLRAEAVEAVLREHADCDYVLTDDYDAAFECRILVEGPSPSLAVMVRRHVATAIVAALPVLAADREGDLSDRLRASLLAPATRRAERLKTQRDEARKQLAVERGKVAAVQAVVATVRRDHTMPPNKDSHGHDYRSGWWDAVIFASDLLQKSDHAALADPGQRESGT